MYVFIFLSKSIEDCNNLTNFCTHLCTFHLSTTPLCHTVTYLLPPPSAPFFPRKGKKKEKKNHELIECKDLVLFTFVF